MTGKQRDTEILVFLWKWKVATTLTIARRFFFRCSHMHKAYCRLMELKKARLVERYFIGPSDDCVWTISKLGFTSIKPLLLNMKEVGFRSENFRHDLIACAVHLGNWIDGIPDGAELFSEQQVRCYEVSQCPDWVPASRERIVDGYWKIPTTRGYKVVALEVELSLKSDKEYQDIGYFYADTQSIQQVVWIVRSPITAARLEKLFRNLDTPRKDIHDFVVLSEFLKSGWRAEINCGPHAGLSLASQVEKGMGESRGNGGGKWGKVFSPCDILDARVTPYNSKGYVERAGPGSPVVLGR